MGAVWILLALASSANGGEEEAEKAVVTARNAFEYRDFEAVLTALEPWVHPPRIVSPKLMLEARRLMGVSLHVLGQIPPAKEEFAQLLLLDPRHQLDPVVIPPQVIGTFEEVRAEMKETLNRVLAERGEKPLEENTGPAKVELRVVPSAAIAFIPFGGPQFALDQPALGAALGLGQVAGLGLNLFGLITAYNEAQKPSYASGAPGGFEQSAYDRGFWMSVAGLVLWASSYAVSGVLGYVEVNARQATASVP